MLIEEDGVGDERPVTCEGTVSRKTDLEQSIRESYSLIREYEDIIRLSDRPKEKLRARSAATSLFTACYRKPLRNCGSGSMEGRSEAGKTTIRW